MVQLILGMLPNPISLVNPQPIGTDNIVYCKTVCLDIKIC